jgi:hypothetical protein
MFGVVFWIGIAAALCRLSWQNEIYDSQAEWYLAGIFYLSLLLVPVGGVVGIIVRRPIRGMLIGLAVWIVLVPLLLPMFQVARE